MKQRDFTAERQSVLALIVATAVLCVAGSIAQFLPLPEEAKPALLWVVTLAFAGVAGFSLWVANGAAGCVQIIAKERGNKAWRSVAFWIALACSVMTGMVSVLGVHLSWLILIGERQALPAIIWIDAAGLGLAFVKVAMGYVVEECEQIMAAESRADDALLKAKDRRITQLEAELRELRAENPKQANGVSKAKPAARASGHAARAMANQIARAEPSVSASQKAPMVEERFEPEARDVSLAEIKAACAKIMSQIGEDSLPVTPSLRLVARECNVPRSRIDKALTAAHLKLVDVTEQLRAA